MNADAGFPQAFSQTVGERSYRFALYVNVAEDLLESLDADAIVELPVPRAFLVVRVERESGTGPGERLFLRRVVPGRAYAAHELTFSFDEIAVAVANLNAAGAYGSSVKGGVAPRWPS